MSGYDATRGVFHLTKERMRHWLRSERDRTIEAKTITQYCIKLLEKAGLTVISANRHGIDVVADTAQVWTVLSGQIATFGHEDPPAAKVYREFMRFHGWLSPVDIGKHFKPVLRGYKVDQLLERFGFQTKGDQGWEATPKARGLHKFDRPSRVDGNNPTLILFWRVQIVDFLMDAIDKEREQTSDKKLPQRDMQYNPWGPG